MTRKTIALMLTSLFALNACNDEKRPTTHTDEHNASTHPNIVHNSKRGDGNARTHRTPAPSPSPAPAPQPAPNRTPNTHTNKSRTYAKKSNKPKLNSPSEPTTHQQNSLYKT